MKRVLPALASLLILSACGGMTRAVSVLPNTTDDLAKKSQAFRKPAPADVRPTTRAP